MIDPRPAAGWALESDRERTLEAARQTRARIAGFVRHTPLVELDPPPACPPDPPWRGAGPPWRGAGSPREVPTRLLKLESLQRTGSFKVRGAASAVTFGPLPREIVAASTGNHGLAVASIASALDVPCRVFVPTTAARAKLARLRKAGIALVEVDGDPLRAELAAREEAERSADTLLVAPYNDPQVILGAATLGLELLEDLGEPPDALFAAVGGGGLISGIALAVRARWPRCTIVGCVPEASPAMRDAVAAGRVVSSPVRPTLADATAGNLEEGSITVAICAALVDEFALISEPEIAGAMHTALLEHRLVIEGAAALALAASLARSDLARHVVVLSGGNVGGETLRAVL